MSSLRKLGTNRYMFFETRAAQYLSTYRQKNERQIAFGEKLFLLCGWELLDSYFTYLIYAC